MQLTRGQITKKKKIAWSPPSVTQLRVSATRTKPLSMAFSLNALMSKSVYTCRQSYDPATSSPPTPPHPLPQPTIRLISLGVRYLHTVEGAKCTRLMERDVSRYGSTEDTQGVGRHPLFSARLYTPLIQFSTHTEISKLHDTSTVIHSSGS